MAVELANVLLAGSGAREHAMAAAIKSSPLVNEVYVAPGNAGTAQVGTNLDVSATDIDGLIRAGHDKKINFFLAGSENTYALGVVDAFAEEGIDAYGTDLDQTRLETDKIYSQKVMEECGIPCPEGYAAENYDSAMQFLKDSEWDELVIKAAGPCGGKGVELPKNRIEAKRIVKEFMIDGKHGDAGKRILFQKREYGLETSLIALVSGEEIVGMPLTHDYKLKLDGNRGPNTGGMGCIIDLDSQAPQDWLDTYIRPVAKKFADRGKPINSLMYAQLMHTKDGIKVLEYNMRGGDPETQTQLRLLTPKSDFYLALRRSIDGLLDPKVVEFDYKKAAACLVLAAEGYPESPKTGDKINGLDHQLEEGVQLFHGGTKLLKDGSVITAGGRVLNITATGQDLSETIVKMYQEAESQNVLFDGMWYRNDIGIKYGNS